MQAPTAVACTPTTGLFALQGPGRSRHKEWKWMSISAKRINGMPFSPLALETEGLPDEPALPNRVFVFTLKSPKAGFLVALFRPVWVKPYHEVASAVLAPLWSSIKMLARVELPDVAACTMKSSLISIFLVAAASAAEMLDWPAGHPAEWESMAASKLPSGVSRRHPDDSDMVLTTVRVRRVDVDGDRIADLIVDMGGGGTGGSCVIVYRREGERYRKVLEEQGGIVVSKDSSRIECWSRAGGMRMRRTVYRYDGNRFIELFTDTLEGPFDGDKFKVLARDNPASK